MSAANDGEHTAPTALGDVDLHVDFARFDALEGDRVDMRQRHPPLPERIEYGEPAGVNPSGEGDADAPEQRAVVGFAEFGLLGGVAVVMADDQGQRDELEIGVAA